MNRDDNKGRYHFGSEMIYSKYYAVFGYFHPCAKICIYSKILVLVEIFINLICRLDN